MNFDMKRQNKKKKKKKKKYREPKTHRRNLTFCEFILTRCQCSSQSNDLSRREINAFGKLITA